ncbi:hypothetical protein RYX36_027649 [Vicia faba]
MAEERRCRAIGTFGFSRRGCLNGSGEHSQREGGGSYLAGRVRTRCLGFAGVKAEDGSGLRSGREVDPVRCGLGLRGLLVVLLLFLYKKTKMATYKTTMINDNEGVFLLVLRYDSAMFFSLCFVDVVTLLNLKLVIKMPQKQSDKNKINVKL